MKKAPTERYSCIQACEEDGIPGIQFLERKRSGCGGSAVNMEGAVRLSLSNSNRGSLLKLSQVGVWARLLAA